MSRRPPFHQLGVALANGKLPAAGQCSTDDLLPSTWPGGPNNSKLPAGSGARHRRLSARHTQNGGPLQHAARRMPPLVARSQSVFPPQTAAATVKSHEIPGGGSARASATMKSHRKPRANITRVGPRRRLNQGLRHGDLAPKPTANITRFEPRRKLCQGLRHSETAPTNSKHHQG